MKAANFISSVRCVLNSQSRWCIRAVYLAAWVACPGEAQFTEGRAMGVYASSLGAGAASASRRLALHHNPAAFIGSSWGAQAFGHHPFELEDLGVVEGYLFRDFKEWGLSAGYFQMSAWELYLERNYQAQVAWKPHQSTGIGISLSARSLEMVGFGQQWYAMGAIGATFEPSEFLSLGAFHRKWTEVEGTSLDRGLWQLGFELKAPGRLTLKHDWIKDRWRPWRFSLGQSVFLGDWMEVELSLGNKPLRLGLGAALSWSGGRLHWSQASHEVLGATRHYGISWIFKGDSQKKSD